MTTDELNIAVSRGQYFKYMYLNNVFQILFCILSFAFGWDEFHVICIKIISDFIMSFYSQIAISTFTQMYTVEYI